MWSAVDTWHRGHRGRCPPQPRLSTSGGMDGRDRPSSWQLAGRPGVGRFRKLREGGTSRRALLLSLRSECGRDPVRGSPVHLLICPAASPPCPGPGQPFPAYSAAVIPFCGSLLSHLCPGQAQRLVPAPGSPSLLSFPHHPSWRHSVIPCLAGAWPHVTCPGKALGLQDKGAEERLVGRRGQLGGRWGRPRAAGLWLADGGSATPCGEPGQGLGTPRLWGGGDSRQGRH